ncbi:DUF2127 domain-containing protein [Silvibacterium sp.]|uniref:DUF2127 domain-containing protein n=1 Tax=Silvibacterium sp. TaxID=1964179 RepID=UPI0039E53F60
MTESTPKPSTSTNIKSANASASLLPGMAIVCLWMLGECALGLFGVITHHLPPIALLVSVAFAVAANGLLKLRRWGWALTLAAVFLSLCYGCFLLFRFHQGPMIVMVVVNLVFFLYLIRPEVLERLK